MCLHDHHLNNIKKLDYIPVGLGKNKFSNEWLKDSENLNISDKNPYYGEYTFYYWFWKNILSSLKDKTWIGFTGYRYHWSSNDILSSDELNKIINQENFKDHILSIEFREAFKPRRGRINCSLNDDGKWRWFGTQFVINRN